MDSLNPSVYRKQLQKKLAESDKYTKEEKVILNNQIILSEMNGSPLDELRQKLFCDEELGNLPTDEMGDEAPEDMGIGEMGDEDPTVKDIPGEEGDLILGGDELEGDEVEPVEDLESVEEPAGRNMDDVVSDTILEILNHFKDIRDQYVEEDPDKADIVRKVYDYLFKAKDKIVNEINKANEPQQPVI